MSTPTPRSIQRLAIVVLAAALTVTTGSLLGFGPMARAIDGPVDFVYVATGENFPDALAGATLASAQGAPLLLVNRDSIPAATIAALEDLDANRIVILGGTAAVSNGVRDQLVPYASSGLVTRIAGPDRAATAAAIAAQLPEVQPGKVYHINVNPSGGVRTTLTSDALQDTTVFRPAGQAVGHYCVNIPNGLFDHFGTVGTIQSSTSTGTAGPDTIRITSTFSGPCQQAGAEIDVRLAADDGTLENGYFTLLIPGRD